MDGRYHRNDVVAFVVFVTIPENINLGIISRIGQEKPVTRHTNFS